MGVSVLQDILYFDGSFLFGIWSFEFNLDLLWAINKLRSIIPLNNILTRRTTLASDFWKAVLNYNSFTALYTKLFVSNSFFFLLHPTGTFFLKRAQEQHLSLAQQPLVTPWQQERFTPHRRALCPEIACQEGLSSLRSHQNIAPGSALPWSL